MSKTLKPRDWQAIGVSCGDASDLTTELCLQGGQPIGIGEKIHILEALPNELAKTWPRRFLRAIKPGADLSNVWPQFAHWLLVDEKYGVIQFTKTDAKREAIQSVADLYQFQAEGMVIDAGDWREAQIAAADAADADAARSEWRIAQSEKLLELLSQGKAVRSE